MIGLIRFELSPWIRHSLCTVSGNHLERNESDREGGKGEKKRAHEHKERAAGPHFSLPGFQKEREEPACPPRRLRTPSPVRLVRWGKGSMQVRAGHWPGEGEPQKQLEKGLWSKTLPCIRPQTTLVHEVPGLGSYLLWHHRASGVPDGTA